MLITCTFLLRGTRGYPAQHLGPSYQNLHTILVKKVLLKIVLSKNSLLKSCSTGHIFLLEIIFIGLKLDENEPSSSNGKQEKRIWNLEKLKMYFAYCRQLEIDMSPDASNVISRYYIRQRNHALTENLPRTTTRLLHSLIRLAEG